MWQHFSERARKAVFYTLEEAQKFDERWVSTEHFLLGIVRESDSTASRVLEKLGVSSNKVRMEVERQLLRGDGYSANDVVLTPRAKRMIDLAYDEVLDLNHQLIGTEHLLLGLIREGDGLAWRVLTKLGIDLETARREVLILRPRGGPVKEPNPVTLRSSIEFTPLKVLNGEGGKTISELMTEWSDKKYEKVNFLFDFSELKAPFREALLQALSDNFATLTIDSYAIRQDNPKAEVYVVLKKRGKKGGLRVGQKIDMAELMKVT